MLSQSKKISLFLSYAKLEKMNYACSNAIQ